MEISIVKIMVILILASLGWWGIETINPPAMLKNIAKVLLVFVAVLALLTSMGLLGNYAHITVY